MSTYEVKVKNEQTGEERQIMLWSLSAADATVDATAHMFKEHGWRKVTAWPAQEIAQA